MIPLPAFRSIVKVDSLGEHINDEAYNGTPGWIFTTDTSAVCYGYEHEGKCYIPISNDEFEYATAEAAAADKHLLRFAIGEGMFPSFNQAIGERIKANLEEIAFDVMRQKKSGDISPEQDAAQNRAVDELVEVMIAVWLQND